MSLKTNFRNLGMTIFLFCLPMLLFIWILLRSYYNTSELQWRDSASRSAVFFGFVSLITFPGFLLHFNYYLYDKRKSIQFESRHIEFSYQSHTYRICISDIEKVRIHTLLWSRLPWNNYGYTEVVMRNGDSLKFSSLVSDTNLSKHYFESHAIIVEREVEFYTWIK